MDTPGARLFHRTHFVKQVYTSSPVAQTVSLKHGSFFSSSPKTNKRYRCFDLCTQLPNLELDYHSIVKLGILALSEVSKFSFNFIVSCPSRCKV